MTRRDIFSVPILANRLHADWVEETLVKHWVSRWGGYMGNQVVETTTRGPHWYQWVLQLKRNGIRVNVSFMRNGNNPKVWLASKLIAGPDATITKAEKFAWLITNHHAGSSKR